MPEDGNTRRVLFIVDDDADLLRALARVLKRRFDVAIFSEPGRALRQLASGDRCDLILCDVTMPVLDGVEFARRAVALRPPLQGRIVLMTGGTDALEAHRLDESFLPVLPKPVDLQLLTALFADMMAAPVPAERAHRAP